MAEGAAAAVIEGAQAAAQIAENVVASAETAVAAAVAHAAAADEARDLMAEAALRDALGKLIADMQEDVDTWHEEIASLRSLVTAQTEQLNHLSTSLAEALTRLPPIVLVAPAGPIQEPSISNPNSEAPAPSVTVVDPNLAPVAEVGPLAQPTKRSRFHLT